MSQKFKVSGVISDIVVTENVTKSGEPWKAAEFTVTEEVSKYPNAIRLKQFGIGDKTKYVDSFISSNKSGDRVTVEYSSVVRKYENKKTGKVSFFQENNVWKVEGNSNSSVSNKPLTREEAFDSIDSGSSDLPF